MLRSVAYHRVEASSPLSNPSSQRQCRRTFPITTMLLFSLLCLLSGPVEVETQRYPCQSDGDCPGVPCVNSFCGGFPSNYDPASFTLPPPLSKVLQSMSMMSFLMNGNSGATATTTSPSSSISSPSPSTPTSTITLNDFLPSTSYSSPLTTPTPTPTPTPTSIDNSSASVTTSASESLDVKLLHNHFVQAVGIITFAVLAVAIGVCGFCCILRYRSSKKQLAALHDDDLNSRVTPDISHDLETSSQQLFADPEVQEVTFENSELSDRGSPQPITNRPHYTSVFIEQSLFGSHGASTSSVDLSSTTNSPYLQQHHFMSSSNE